MDGGYTAGCRECHWYARQSLRAEWMDLTELAVPWWRQIKKVELLVFSRQEFTLHVQAGHFGVGLVGGLVNHKCNEGLQRVWDPNCTRLSGETVYIVTRVCRV